MPRRAYVLLAIATSVVLLFAGTVWYRLHTNGDLTDDGSSAAEFSVADVNGHNTAADCWIIVGTKVYNISSYLAENPTNTTFNGLCGSDATQQLHAASPSEQALKLQKLITPYYIGLVVP